MTRVAAYIRVSSQEQTEGYSLAAQERAITQYAAAHGWEIVAWYRDEGLSARVDDIAKRPAFRDMLDDARAGKFSVICVHKLDRFARNRQVAFNSFAELAKIRVGFASIAENMDYSTPAGQLMLTMLVGMSQFYSDNLSLETKKGKAERKRQGIYNGLLPFGVTLDAHGIPVPDTAPWACHLATRDELVPFHGLELAFRLAADGQSDRDIAAALTARGFRTSGNRGQNPFTKDSVRVILRNRFYVGELPDGDDWIPARHSPIIDPALFDAAQRARERNTRRRLTLPATAQPWALSGLLTCGLCGSPIRVRGTAAGERYLGCGGRSQGRGCTLPGERMSDLIAMVAGLLDDLTATPRARERALAAYRAERSSAVDRQAQRLIIERKLARLRELYLEGDVGKEEYHQRRTALHAERDALPAIVTITDNEIDALWLGLEDAARRFRDATPTVQHEICRDLFSSVILNDNRTVEVNPRSELSAFFATSGSDGERSHEWRSGRTGVGVSFVPQRRARGKLDAVTVAWIRSQHGRSLRDLAAVCGVSAETIRKARKG